MNPTCLTLLPASPPSVGVSDQSPSSAAGQDIIGSATGELWLAHPDPVVSGLDEAAVAPIDPIAMLLADKRSPATRKGYASDLRHFFDHDATPERVAKFLALPASGVALRLAHYKGGLMERGLSEAHVNRRLAAIKSLLKFAHRLGLAETDGRGLVDGERVRAYRDTRGVGLPVLRRLIDAPDTSTLRGLRDRALLLLLCQNALRRAEVCALDVENFVPEEQRLLVHGKGRGTQQEPVTLSANAVAAISAYLASAGHGDVPGAPLFRNVDRRPGKSGSRLTADGLHWLVGHYGRQVGVTGLTPHKLRHSAITAALDATGGDVRRVQRLSRHAKVDVLLRYDDNRSDFQGEVTRALDALTVSG